MRHLFWIPVGLLLTAAAVALILRQTKGGYHAQELGFAAGITVISAELAMVPMYLTRRAGAVANFQAAFGGTVIHLFLTFAAGAAAFGLGLVGDRQLFLFLLLGFYWIALVFVVIAMIKAFRRSLPQADPAAGQAAGAKGT